MIEKTSVAGGLMETVFEESIEDIKDTDFYRKIKHTTEIAKSYFFGCKKNPYIKIECGLDIHIKSPKVYEFKIPNCYYEEIKYIKLN